MLLLENMEINFSPGLNVFTGETGAGKSILVGALSLILGERADGRVVRDGCAKAEISAEFDIEGLGLVQNILEENDL